VDHATPEGPPELRRSPFHCTSCGRYVDDSDLGRAVWTLVGRADAWLTFCGQECATAHEVTRPDGTLEQRSTR
jgi:hypothetical protein